MSVGYCEVCRGDASGRKDFGLIPAVRLLRCGGLTHPSWSADAKDCGILNR